MIFANAFLRWLVNVEPGDDREPEFTWMNLPESWGVFVLIGIVVALAFFVFWTYVRELKTCPFGLRVTLGVFRFIVLFLLVLVFLQPSISFKKDRVRKPNIVLAVDVSGSMAIRDEYRDPQVISQLASKLGYEEEQLQTGKISRMELVQKAIDRNEQEFLVSLLEKGAIRVNEFETTSKTATTLTSQESSEDEASDGDDSEEDGKKTDDQSDDKAGAATGKKDGSDNNAEKSNADKSKSGNPADEDPAAENKKGKTGRKKLKLDTPRGRGTNVWLALKDALQTTQISSIILISDGQVTTEDDVKGIAEEARNKGVPIFVVGVGDPYKTKNVWVKDVVVPPQAVNPGDPFDVLGIIGFQRVGVSALTVQLVRQEVIGDDYGPEEEAMTEIVPLPTKNVDEEDQQGIAEVKFRPALTNPGKYRYRLKILTEIPDEEKLDDNSGYSSNVEVTDEKARILLVSGAPTWEYQLIQRLLRRDPTYELSCWLQSMDLERQQEGNISIDRLPETLLEMSEYNAIILIDPDPQKDLDQNFFDLLKEFAEKKAGGVMFMAGPKYTSMTLSLSKAETLKKILPVEFPDASTTLVGFDGAASVSTKMEVNIPNINHQVMRFFQDANENLTQWQAMPGVYWSYPAAKAKPITKVLVEHGEITLAVDSENPRPLLVAGRYGLGNTLYMGFNGTWRWRRIGRQAHYFDAFWINVAKFLVANRSLQGVNRGTVGTDKPNFEIGERVVFHANLLDPQMKNMEVDSVDGGLYLGVEQVAPLRFKKVTPGEYEASWIASRVGTLDAKLDIGGAVVKTAIKVDVPRAEFKATSRNDVMLREIAKESGGEFFTLENLDLVPGVVPEKSRRYPQTTTPEPIWGMPEVRREFLLFCFILPFVLLTAEWALRKGFKLL